MRENFSSCSVLVLVERDELIQEDFSFYYFDGWWMKITLFLEWGVEGMGNLIVMMAISYMLCHAEGMSSCTVIKLGLIFWKLELFMPGGVIEMSWEFRLKWKH